ncbi:MAG TPA: VWA domain-containing protein [Pyrinomonadaceae bacterium]|nr:VWA domain-containing protein [Pyrinomonadaceae bacterium]
MKIVQSSKLKVQNSKLGWRSFCFLLLTAYCLLLTVNAQTFQKEFKFKADGLIDVTNFYGRVKVEAKATKEGEDDKVLLIANSSKTLTEKDFEINSAGGKIKINVNPQNAKTRLDLTVQVPERVRLKIETEEGEVSIDGNIFSAEVFTDTGTIATNIPLENIKYEFMWTQSRPRYLSDIDIEEVKEKSAGRFEIKGKFVDEEAIKAKAEKAAKEKENATETTEPTPTPEPTPTKEDDKKDKKKTIDGNAISLKFSTARGIILLNVSPTEVSSDLRERPLTEAAKAIVRSGDSMLTEAIRRASPKYFGDYLKTLPPRRITPNLVDKPRVENNGVAKIKQVIARVVDSNNRAVGGLEKKDFVVTEYGKEREILSVEPVTAPFNLVLLLDVSGSVENYVNFIRKAARNFLNTMRPNDKISIVIFSEDVKQISVFTTNRNQLSESLDTFDAGGATAYYDAIAYTLVDTLKPFKGERTALVVLSDGDDNRSFLPFDSLLGSIQESGALIYPLYVPSGLVAASATNSASQTVDPLRTRYMGLTSKAEEEGARLAKVSGGVYYPIRRLDDLQKAYEDIVVQLRTAYTVTFRSDSSDVGDSASPRLRVKVNVLGTFVNLGAVTEVSNKVVSSLKKEEPNDFKFAPISYSIPQPPPEITGEITDIHYKTSLGNTLKKISAEGFDVNKSPPAFLFGELAVSRWVSPKRTRSYPYERIYNTLTSPRKATIIPIIKDEGKDGERDFLQFDTFSLMNLLDVYLILGYYNEAQRDSKNELTDQQFDNAFILNKLNELQNFKGTATEWNLKELQGIAQIAEKAKTAYAEIAKRTSVTLHDEKGIDNFVIKISKSLEDFRTLSRQKSQKAQGREFATIQPKEALSSDTKARVTISDKDGGLYYFTCDETKIEGKNLTLMEAKHTIRAKIPSASDIKDGLVKMMIYTNLKNVKVGSENVALKVALKLTSNKLEGSISSNAEAQKVDDFLQVNSFSKNQTGFVKKLFQEAKENNFEIILEHGETAN